jgi:nucleoside-diphosphate-sugar epimerase
VAVYGVNRAPLIDESAPTPPVGQRYPDSKIAAEALVRGSWLPWVIVRPASTYGPRGGAWTIGPIEQIKAGRLVLLGRDAGLVTTGYIDNVVDGLLLALAQPIAVGQAFNLCDDRAVTFREFYLAYARMLGKERLPTVPGWFATLARTTPAGLARRLLGRPAIGPWSLHFRRNPSQFSVAKAGRLLGYAPAVDFAEGMRRTEAWLRAAGYLS